MKWFLANVILFHCLTGRRVRLICQIRGEKSCNTSIENIHLLKTAKKAICVKFDTFFFWKLLCQSCSRVNII